MGNNTCVFASLGCVGSSSTKNISFLGNSPQLIRNKLRNMLLVGFEEKQGLKDTNARK